MRVPGRSRPSPSPARYTPLAAGPAPAGETAGPAPAHCANCGTPADDAFCPRCGQERRDWHRPLRTLASEALDALVGWDGKLPRTLWLLVRRPGGLTAEFLAGRRARYLRPLRLYLSFSVALLLALSRGGGSDGRADAAPAAATGVRDSATTTPEQPRGAQFGGLQVRIGRDAQGDSAARAGATPDDLQAALARTLPADTTRLVGRLGAAIQARYDQVSRLSSDQLERAFREAFLSHLGQAVFAILPLFALLLRVLYWRRPLFLAEHFVFALHVHAFAMLAMTAAALAPGDWSLLFVLWTPAYVWLALRRVYGGSRFRTTATFALLGVTYGTILGLAIAVAVLVGVLLGA